jgi:hypothetical protein
LWVARIDGKVAGVRLVWGLASVAALLATLVFGIRALYLYADGRPQVGASVAFGVSTLLLTVLSSVPALRPPRPPAVTVTHPDAGPGETYGYDVYEYEYTRDAEGNLYRYEEAGPRRMPPPPPPPQWWNGLGRSMLILDWLVRSAVAGYVAYYITQERDRGFSLTLAALAVALLLLGLLRRIGSQLAGFVLAWSAYRGWAGVRKLVNAAVQVTLAGYAFLVADVLDTVLGAIPRFVYRGLDSLWHLPWFNVPIVVVVCLIVLIMLSALVARVQRLVARALGPDSAFGEKLDDLRLIKWQGDLRAFRRSHDDDDDDDW